MKNGRKEEKERNSVFIVVRRSALGKGRSSFKVGERLYYTDSFGSILPTLHSSIHYKFPDSSSSPDKTRGGDGSRGIFITRRTSILCPIDSLQFHQFVYFATNESRKVSLLCRDQGRLIAMRNRRKCNFLDEVTRGNNCLFIGYRRFIKFLLSSKRVGVHKGSISKAFPNKNDE